jgi:hypothetical protein
MKTTTTEIPNEKQSAEICGVCGMLLTLKHIYEHIGSRASAVVRSDPTSEPEYKLIARLNDAQLQEMFAQYWRELSVASTSKDSSQELCHETAWVVRAFLREFEDRVSELWKKDRTEIEADLKSDAIVVPISLPNKAEPKAETADVDSFAGLGAEEPQL